MKDKDWDYTEWSFQLRVRAKTKEKLLEIVETLLEAIKTGEADIVVGFDKDMVLKMKKTSTPNQKGK